MWEHARKQVRSEGRNSSDLVDIELLDDDPKPSVSLVRPRFIIADRADTCKEIDITHNFGIHQGRNFINRNFALLTIETNLVRSNKHVNSRPRLFTKRRIAKR